MRWTAAVQRRGRQRQPGHLGHADDFLHRRHRHREHLAGDAEGDELVVLHRVGFTGRHAALGEYGERAASGEASGDERKRGDKGERSMFHGPAPE